MTRLGRLPPLTNVIAITFRYNTATCIYIVSLACTYENVCHMYLLREKATNPHYVYIHAVIIHVACMYCSVDYMYVICTDG